MGEKTHLQVHPDPDPDPRSINADFHQRARVDLAAVHEPEQDAEQQDRAEDEDGPVHRVGRGGGAGRPEGEEDAHDAVEDGDDVEREAGAAEPEGSPADRRGRGGEAFVQHDRRRREEGRVKGRDDETGEGVECRGRGDIDQGEEEVDQRGETDGPQGECGSWFNLNGREVRTGVEETGGEGGRFSPKKEKPGARASHHPPWQDDQTRVNRVPEQRPMSFETP